ncbi:unnamed protein product [Cuscuta campestris]|uniref:ABC transporter domain-containing protein n=1 Tax=Cuscuta campestris TaxID=132261 RepID=A0A484MGX2_9ASTE|nr:unnamed protein product [Cuscuta campestris]
MEINDSHKSSGSFRVSSSSLWRAGGMDAFVKSSRQEDEERALYWAALQKAPTFDRLKKGLVTGLRGETCEVDIKNIGYEEKKKIVERLIKVPKRDNEKFLLKLKDRFDRVAIDIPTVEVRFEHLNVGAEIYVGKRALPSITNLSLNILEGLLSYLNLPTNKKHISVLHDVSGIIKPGRMTLLLGPPSSGKTTLLLALAGKLDPSFETSGRVSYNGHEMNEFVPMRTAAYISQHDLHIPEMTARETLAFSARCQGVGSRYEMLAELSRREKAANIMPDPDIDIFMKAAATHGKEANVVVDYIIKILGLEGCEDTIVGSEMLRGMSGGERKRLTIAISLLQPAPECYDLFDDIILISEGRIVYQGPRDYVLDFFECMGFRCPERKGVADFLQEVTSRKDQKQYWVNKGRPYRFLTVKEFSEAFQSFHIGRNLGDELATPFQKARSHPAALATKRYGVKVSLWVFSTYYVIGYDPNAGRLFKQWLLLLIFKQYSSALFRCAAVVSRSLIMAFVAGSFLMLIFVCLGGFILSRALAHSSTIISPESEGSLNRVSLQEIKNLGVMGERLELLKGVSGAFRPGILTALMGISGAGKTTLMDVLAGRKTGGYIEGEISISGFAKKQKTFARISGYCEQNDIHSPYLTVYESLTFSAWLRLPSEVSSEIRTMFIEEVLELVELTTLREALVGLPEVNGLSTGQRKRLTIAVELVANPSILFMDEPTTGLDARAAAIIMRTIRNIVNTGRTIACTIHQPSIDIFEAFDESIEGISRIRKGLNPATWVLEITASENEEALGINFNEIYRNSELYLSKAQDLFNAMGSMYTSVLFTGALNAFTVQQVVVLERTVFYRERAAGMYSAMPFAFAMVVIELPYVLLQAIIYSTMVYSMIGFEWTVTKFSWYLLIMFLTFLYSTFLGMMSVSLAPNVDIASIFSIASLGIWNLFSGFLIPRPLAPVWWRWCYLLSPVAWTLYGLVGSQFGDVEDVLETFDTVESFLRVYFGFRRDFLGETAAILSAFVLLFALIFAFCMKLFNFQKRRGEEKADTQKHRIRELERNLAEMDPNLTALSQSFERFKAALMRKDFDTCTGLLPQLKVMLTEFKSLPPVFGETPNAVQELTIARDIYEHAVILALKMEDQDAFERDFFQLKPYYTDARKLPQSPQEYPILGLNLLRLLVQNRIAEFHTELELLSSNALENPCIKHAVELEQSFMEGAYNRVLSARQAVPHEAYTYFMDVLAKTVRDEIAGCSEKAYDSLSIKDAQQMLLFSSDQELLEYVTEEHPEWVVKDGLIIFQRVKDSAPCKEIPSLQLINQTLSYARELERII